MNDQKPLSLQLVLPHELCASMGTWVRVVRQRADLTQPMLAARAGVPVASLSRLERTGLGSTLLLSKLLFALAESDALEEFVRERTRLALLPRNLADMPQSLQMPKRVRPGKRRQ